MKKVLTTITLIFSIFGAFAQTSYMPGLKKQLDSLLREDQKYRELFAFGTYKTKENSLSKVFNVPASGLFNAINNRMIEADSSNTRIIQHIFRFMATLASPLSGTRPMKLFKR